jgi:MFS transporter, DHA1 family, inner membrane transport protein
MPRLLYLFALCNLVIGTGAFVISGILAPIGADLNVSVAAAGQAVTAYALATAVLAPIALIATGRWPRRRVLCLAMLVFAAGNVLCVLSTTLPGLLVGRVLMGVGAMFTPVAAGIAVALVAPTRRGRALSLVFLGISLSYVVGVPLGAWLGLRYGWQVPVALVVAAALVCTVTLAALLPRDIQAPGASLRNLPAVLREPAVLWTLSLTLLYFTAIFAVFSYIGPVLQALQPMSAEKLSLTLMIFGLSGVAGTLVGGWANDRFGAQRSLTLQLSVLGMTMVLLPLMQGAYAAMVLVLVVWGIAGFGMMTPQQSRLATLSLAQAPLLLSLNTSMLYFGTALGAAIGGAAVAHVGFAQLAWIGVPFTVAGLFTLWKSGRKAALLKAA